MTIIKVILTITPALCSSLTIAPCPLDSGSFDSLLYHVEPSLHLDGPSFRSRGREGAGSENIVTKVLVTIKPVKIHITMELGLRVMR